MSHLGIQILYDMFNRREDVWCEACLFTMDGSRQDHEGAGSPSFYAGISGSGQIFRFSGNHASSMRCATPISCRSWIWHRSRCMHQTVQRKIRLSSAAVHVPTIRSRWQISLICSISEREKSVYDELLDLYKRMESSGEIQTGFLEKAAADSGNLCSVFL